MNEIGLIYYTNYKNPLKMNKGTRYKILNHKTCKV